MASNMHGIITAVYDKRQKQAAEELEARKAMVFRQIPRLAEIESEVQQAGIKYNRMILLGSEPSAEAVSKLLDEISTLKAEKLSLLKSGGYKADFLEPDYTCSKCSDTGKILKAEGSVEQCSCYKQLLLDQLYSRSNLGLSAKESFESFDESLYPDTSNEKRFGIKISPRENINYIRRGCQNFIDGFTVPETRNLYFSGATGTGKTYMSNCIAVELMRKGITVLYQTAPSLFNTIYEYKMRNMKEEGPQEAIYRQIMETELLIIDDLGTEPPSAARYADLLTILNARQAGNTTKPCKTIISTNIDLRQLGDYYDERVVSRIIGGFDMYKFAGDDIRSVKRQRCI